MISKKRHREALAPETRLVEIYEDLANLDEKVRLSAAHALLTSFIAGNNAENNRQRLSTVFNRLARGLCSSRKAARIGFSVALTELLTYLTKDGKQDVLGYKNGHTLLKALQRQTTASNGVSAQVSRVLNL